MLNIDILLATFNSERFLREQIESIIDQTRSDWRLIVRDAGSTDNTIAIIGEFARKDKRIWYIGSDCADVAANFSELMMRSTAKYVMFADHDDVWMEDKLARTFLKMEELEAKNGKDAPLLVFTDALVTDSDLRIVDDSLFYRTKINPYRLNPEQLILQNVANGNTMLFNAALRDKAKQIPKEAFMHDHWISLVASVFGKIACVEVPTLLYRQHDNNVLGGMKVGVSYYCRKVLCEIPVLRKKLRAYFRQAEAFALRYPDAPSCFKACVGFKNRNWLMRRWLLLRYGILKNGFIRNLGTFLIV